MVPGGACYTEWRSEVGEAGAIEARLRAAGFQDVACYRRWPRSARLPVYWIPVGSPAAEAYVRGRARLRGGRLKRLLAEAAGRVSDVARGSSGARICALARRPGGPSAAETDPIRLVRASLPSGRASDDIALLLVTGGPRAVSKVVLLAFAGRSLEPVAAVKAPRVEEAASGVRREAEVLERMGRRQLSGVPHVLAHREIDGVPVVVESAIVGRPLETVLDAPSLASWSGKVTEWLVGLGEGARTRTADHWRATIVEPTLARFRETFGPVVDSGLLRRGEDLVRRIGNLPAVPEQRDFGPWNVFVTAGRSDLAVLDWESSEDEGLPALDLLYYLAYASFSADRAWERDSRILSFERSLDPSSATGSVRVECLARYAHALGLGQADLAPLRALVWLIHCHSDFRHAAADAGSAPSSDALRRSLFLALWKAEVRSLAGQ